MEIKYPEDRLGCVMVTGAFGRIDSEASYVSIVQPNDPVALCVDRFSQFCMTERLSDVRFAVQAACHLRDRRRACC